MSKLNLGRLQQVNLREIWMSEANDFTPWLAQEGNLMLLSQALDLELELEAQEKNVGPFRADILCKDLLTVSWVLIENQIERTDHSHLGQLLTYAAGLEAVTIVWIAEVFTDEHRAALDWLNQITDESINFFGLEIELWRIGDSPVAPKFNLVSQPNEWRKSITQVKRAIEAGDLTETQQMQLEFWTEFRDFLMERKSPVRPSKPFPQHWMSFAIGRSFFGMSAALNSRENRVGAGLTMSGPDGKAHYHLLYANREKIEQQMGNKLGWIENPGKKESHINLHLPAADPLDRQRWPEYMAWLADKLEAFDRVFRPRIKHLNAQDYIPEGEDHG